MGALKAIGFILIVLGILLSLSVLGAIIGVPMIIVGAFIFFMAK